MCDNPDCGNCNPEPKMEIVKQGMELGDAIIEVLNKNTPRPGDTTKDGYSGYVVTMMQSIALAAAAAAMIDNLKLESTQDAMIAQIAANIQKMVDIKRMGNQKEDHSHALRSDMLH